MVVYPAVAALYFVTCWPISQVAVRLELRTAAGQC
jgi:ABC-type amino acid transport system permease subunit